jgi:hypothetical protein
VVERRWCRGGERQRRLTEAGDTPRKAPTAIENEEGEAQLNREENRAGGGRWAPVLGLDKTNRRT